MNNSLFFLTDRFLTNKTFNKFIKLLDDFDICIFKINSRETLKYLPLLHICENKKHMLSQKLRSDVSDDSNDVELLIADYSHEIDKIHTLLYILKYIYNSDFELCKLFDDKCDEFIDEYSN